MRGVELAACIDVVPGKAKEFAEKHGFARACDSLTELLEQVDAVSIVIPTASTPS